jgi:hypothetical protein
MKTIIFIIGLAAGLLGPARAQTNPPVSSPAVTNNISPDALVTKQGVVYEKFYVERADPSGLTISYVPAVGGLGMERVPFSLLSDDWQRRYGYNPEKAAKFDLEQKKAMALWREEMIAAELAAREKRAKEEAAEEAAAAQAKAEAAQKTAEEAAAQVATNSPAMTDTNLPAPPAASGDGY